MRQRVLMETSPYPLAYRRQVSIRAIRIHTMDSHIRERRYRPINRIVFRTIGETFAIVCAEPNR